MRFHENFEISELDLNEGVILMRSREIHNICHFEKKNYAIGWYLVAPDGSIYQCMSKSTIDCLILIDIRLSHTTSAHHLLYSQSIIQIGTIRQKF